MMLRLGASPICAEPDNSAVISIIPTYTWRIKRIWILTHLHMTAVEFKRARYRSVFTASEFYCQNIVLRRSLLSSILSWRRELWVLRTGRERRQANGAEQLDHKRPSRFAETSTGIGQVVWA